MVGIFHCYGGGCQAASLLSAKLFERDFSVNMRWIKSELWLGRVSDEPSRILVGEMSDSVLPIFEVLPLSVVQYYGIIVLALFYVVITVPLLKGRFGIYKAGVFAYLITSIGSSGFWLTPTPYVLSWVLGLVYLLGCGGNSKVKGSVSGVHSL